MDQEIRKFALKCAIAGFTFFITAIFTVHLAGMVVEFHMMEITDIAMAQVQSRITYLSSNIGSRLIDSADTILAEQADPKNNNLPPEKKERMLKNLKIVADKWRPFAQQISTP